MATSEPAVDAAGVSAAAAMLGTVGEFYYIFAILDGAEFEDARQADNPRTVNTSKARGVKALLEGLHGFPEKMNTSACMKF